MRVAAEATRAGFAELTSLIEPGRSERELQVALEAEFLSNGGDFLAFETRRYDAPARSRSLRAGPASSCMTCTAQPRPSSRTD